VQQGIQVPPRIETHPGDRLIERPKLLRPRGRTEVAVADPTTDRETISVVLRGRSLTPVAPAEGVRVSAVAGGTRLDVDTYQLYGRSRTVALEL
ncbi:hypothetical protein ACWDWO_25010, partial [Actinopolymorpha singaporensis]